MLRNENIPVVHQVHAYDDADVALTMALPWVHELGWPPRQCDPAAGPRKLLTRGSACGALLSTPLRSHFFSQVSAKTSSFGPVVRDGAPERGGAFTCRRQVALGHLQLGARCS